MERPMPCRDASTSQPTRKRRRKRRRCKRHPSEGPHSPNCRASSVKGRSSNNTQPLVRTLPALRPMLDFLHVTGDIFTREQIMGHLVEYIKQKALFDPNNPRKVYCQNDQLSIIFGCKEFSTANACELLLQNLETVSATDSCSCSESDQQYLSDPSSSTNTGTYSLPSTSAALSCLDRAAGSKRRKSGSWSDASNVTDINSAEPPYGLYFSPFRPDVFSYEGEEFCEHYKQVCGNTTDVVTDTSDDLFFLNETDDELDTGNNLADETTTDQFAEEYEPISYSDEERLIALSRELGDESSSSEEDTEIDEGEDGGDELDEDEETDSEIEEEDKWKCASCGEQNHPMTRNCRKCWNVRKDWYPTALQRSMSDPVESTTLTEQPSQADQLPDSDPPSTSHTISEINNSDAKCVICLKNHPNGCIIHGQTGHQVCCVGCAKKLKETGKPCPVCRKKIQKVITNFM